VNEKSLPQRQFLLENITVFSVLVFDHPETD